MKQSIFIITITFLIIFSGCNKKSEPASEKDSISITSDSLLERDTLSMNDFIDTTKFKESVKDVKKKIDEKQKELNKEMDEVQKKLEELEK